MKPVSYYAELERKYGLKARRAAEAADKNSEALSHGEISLQDALQNAFGAVYRPGQISGR